MNLIKRFLNLFRKQPIEIHHETMQVSPCICSSHIGTLTFAKTNMIGLGVVYEHFHTAKSNRSPTTRRLVPEMYIEMHVDDAADLGIKDGDKVRIISRRGEYEAKAQVGTSSLVKPVRNGVPRGYMFSPWNLSVADSADPKKNKWLVNGISSRVWDPVSGQVDFKKLAVRIEKVV